MRTLIIPAAGNGNRTSEFYFPKCLLAVNQRPIIFQIIESWSKYVDEVVIVINEKTGLIIKEYMEKYYKNNNMKIVYCLQKKISGTYFAIKEAMLASKNKKYILNWSDVCLEKNIKDDILMGIDEKNIIFTTEKKSCRWQFKENRFINRGPYIIGRGGIWGVFILNSISEEFFSLKSEKDEETEILEKLDPKSFVEIQYEDFVDVGDDGKYTLDVKKADNKTRAFGSSNNMSIYDNVIIKNTSDKKLKDSEENWYKNSNFDFSPKVISYSPLVLEKIDSMTLSERIVLEGKGFESFALKRLFEILKKIHLSKKPVNANFESSYDQYIGKTIKRLEKTNFLFSGFNKKKIEINGKLYENPLVLLKKYEKEFLEIFADSFLFVHGDLQTSNALITKDNKIYVIDPRGYFGDTPLYGDPMYDFAKLYYGFCGMWDKFRAGESKVLFNGDSFSIEPLLSREILDRRRDLFFEETKKVNYVEITEKKIDILHAIIWLSVTDYIANDVLSSLWGYLNGTILINEVCKRYFNGKI